jgi:hypothetical protein
LPALVLAAWLALGVQHERFHLSVLAPKPAVRAFKRNASAEQLSARAELPARAPGVLDAAQVALGLAARDARPLSPGAEVGALATPALGARAGAAAAAAGAAARTAATAATAARSSGPAEASETP